MSRRRQAAERDCLCRYATERNPPSASVVRVFDELLGFGSRSAQELARALRRDGRPSPVIRRPLISHARRSRCSPLAVARSLAAAFLDAGPCARTPPASRCGSERQCDHHRLAIVLAVGRGFVAGQIPGARPQHVDASGQRGVVDACHEPVAVHLRGERVPHTGPCRRRSRSRRRQFLRPARSHELRLASDLPLATSQRPAAAARGHSAASLGLTRCPLLGCLRHRVSRLTASTRRAAARRLAVGKRSTPHGCRALQFVGPSCAQLVVRRCDRCAIALVRIRPDGGKVVSVAPRITALDADVDARWRRVVDSCRHRRQKPRCFPRCPRLERRAPASPPSGTSSSPDGDLAWPIWTWKRIGKWSSGEASTHARSCQAVFCPIDQPPRRAGPRRCPMPCSSAAACR